MLDFSLRKRYVRESTSQRKATRNPRHLETIKKVGSRREPHSDRQRLLTGSDARRVRPGEKDPIVITRITSRTKSTGDTTTLVADDRPTELDSAPHDPDSMTAWMAEGNCRLYPPATFFPSDGVGVDRARKICRDCPVQERCLEYALEERIDHGVWGGCSERERRRILKRRRTEIVGSA